MKFALPKLEKRVIAAALTISAVHLGLIAFAAYKLGITVPTCVPPQADVFKPSVIKKDKRHFEVHMLARMWNFEPNFLRVPVGSTIDLFITSKDVVHGLYLSDTNANLMAVPGSINYVRLNLNKPGRHEVVCHEYCGAGHQNMAALIYVDGSADDIESGGLPGEALNVAAAEKNDVEMLGEPAAEPPSQALALLQAKGCTACHSLDGKPAVGPTFSRLYGKTEELADGSRVTVDEAYLRESMLEPAKRLVKGYAAVMPVLSLSEDEIKQIVEFIKNLSAGGKS